MVPSLLLLSCESSVSLKENPDNKKKEKSAILVYLTAPSKQYSKVISAFASNDHVSNS